MQTALMFNGHLPICSDYCAKVHCPCGFNDAMHGVKWCAPCADLARGRNVPTLHDGPGVRLALRANRAAYFAERR